MSKDLNKVPDSELKRLIDELDDILSKRGKGTPANRVKRAKELISNSPNQYREELNKHLKLALYFKAGDLRPRKK